MRLLTDEGLHLADVSSAHGGCFTPHQSPAATASPEGEALFRTRGFRSKSKPSPSGEGGSRSETDEGLRDKPTLPPANGVLQLTLV